MATLHDRLRTHAPLLLDGAWGTELLRRNATLDSCLESWNIERPTDVQAVARAYVAAGAQAIGTNTFGANRFRLARFGLDYEVTAINRAAVAHSRAAAGADALVIGTMGPSGFPPQERIATRGELRAGFREQATALAESGVDALLVETMEDLEESLAALEAAQDATGLEVICSFAFRRNADGSITTRQGLLPEAMAASMLAAGADGIGANCGLAPQDMADVVSHLHAVFPDALLLAQPNAGQPVAWEQTYVYPETPESMAAWVSALVQAGASIIGGCCGTTPEHIKAMRRSLDKVRNKSSATV